MAATENQITTVREMLGESIPQGGSEADTMFPDGRVTAWIEAATSLEGAALAGWRVKAAHFANLVNVTDGAASREMSDLLDNALAMIKLYSGLAQGPTYGRSRVGKIVRT